MTARSARYRRLTQLFATLCRHGRYPSETRLAKAFDVSQQTLHTWKKSRQQTPTEIRFLRAYALRHALDPVALVDHYELRTARRRLGEPARPDLTPLGKLLSRVEVCVARAGEGGPEWSAIVAVLDAIEYGKKL